MNGNKTFKALLALALVLAVIGLFTPRDLGEPLSPFAYQTDVYLTSGGDKLVVASGGEIEIQSGATADYQEGATYTLPAADYVRLDGDTTNQTQTGGMLDLNMGSVTANTSAVNVALTGDTGTTAAADIFGGVMTLTQDDADGDMFGWSITASATTNATAGSYEAGLVYDCAEDTSGACLDGVRITATGHATAMTDGVDVSHTGIVNAVNVGANDILFGDDTLDGATDDTLQYTRNDSGSVTFTCADNDTNAECIYDSGGTGNVQIGSADTGKVTAYATDDVTIDLTSSTDGEDIIISQDGNNDSSILISAEGSGTDAVQIETITNDGDIVVTSVDNLQLTSTSAGGVIDIDGTAGLVYSIGEDDTTADDIDLGSAKDDVLISGEDITFDTADDADFLVFDDFTFTMETAANIWSVTGTPGFVVNVCTDDTTADDINIGSAKDDVDVLGATIDLIGSVRLVDNSTEIDGAAGGNTVLTWKDFDCTDDDDNATVTVNCTTATTNAEDCDWTLAVQEAGTADNRITVDADDGVDIGSTGNANVTLISGSDTLVHDGDLTLDTDATGGNALAKNEFIGLPRIKFAALSTMANGTSETSIVDYGDTQTPTDDWTAVDGSTTLSSDNTYFRESTHSLKMIVTTAATVNDGCTNPLGTGDQDWSDDESFGMWFYADRTLTAGDLVLHVTDNASDDTVNFPAYSTADTWEWIEINIGGIANGDKDIITDISIELSSAGETVAGGGEFIVYFDFMVKWDGAEEETLGEGIPYDGVLSLAMIDATSGAATTSVLTEYTDYFVHYQSGDDEIVIMSDQSDADKLGLAIIAY